MVTSIPFEWTESNSPSLTSKVPLGNSFSEILPSFLIFTNSSATDKNLVDPELTAIITKIEKYFEG